MTHTSTTNIEKIVEGIILLLKKKFKGDQQILPEKFVREYFKHVAEEDLHDADIENLYGEVFSHWNFSLDRKPNEAKVNVFNPQHEKHGWQSNHSIVDIILTDKPFLVDSIRMALNKRHLTTHLLIHPVMNIKRNPKGRIIDILSNENEVKGSQNEAVIHIEFDRITSAQELNSVREDIELTLNQVSMAVSDWVPMIEQLADVIEKLNKKPVGVGKGEHETAVAFLQWLANDHFALMGYREYELVKTSELLAIPDSGLGILQGETTKSFSRLPKEIRRLASVPNILVITKASRRSPIHRPSYLDTIGIKKFNSKGEVIGERRFIGLYTSAAYNNRPAEIPLLRDKVADVMKLSGHKKGNHTSKALMNIIDNFPRDLLFQITNEDLLRTSQDILHLHERQRIRLFIHPDQYGRFYSCMVFVPKDIFDTGARKKINKVLVDSLGAEDSEFDVMLSDSVLARLHYVLHVTPGPVIDFDLDAIEQKIKDALRNWYDDLHDELLDQFGEELGMKLYRRYGDAFKADYCERYGIRTAIDDIKHMETLQTAEGQIAMSVYRPLETPDGLIRFKLFNIDNPVSLSDALPMLENMGLKVDEEYPSKIYRSGTSMVWMHDFSMSYQGDWKIDLSVIRDKYQNTFARVWSGDVENDGLNRLVLRAELDWREIVVLRAYSRYMHQAGAPFSSEYIEKALSFNHDISASLIALFHSRFDPQQQSDAAKESEKLIQKIEGALENVVSLDEDRILRYFLSLIQATLRTNHYQAQEDGTPKSYLSFKFNPDKVPDLPQPRPKFEIFVYSPRVEGVHLRGGSIARGGLRWSDRREDFRTEVLGLVKAQMVKNAVIVPGGSKGGFFPKKLSLIMDREGIQAEGIACYQTFIRGMLDLTDNIVAGQIVPPKDIVRYDGDDPYLVVAADKGTATFSDIANEISNDYGFWLGDAFASGGSQGYDHKAMGITARGAWESVKRHFSELGLNTQAEPFRVVGIGDMAGDVFGNGMLLSRTINLVAAFNHMHIFLDPTPDAEKSFTERERLFNLPRSSWEDYDKKLISKGGGVFSRAVKSITLTNEVRSLLGTSSKSMTPNQLIRALFCSEVDLIWNGGIGTYVKSTDEHHNDVGDRSNDAVRVDARELGCRVFGEGGNLGVTQLGRIEFAAKGGRIYTDAIDNSAGVDCSDHEVNIKILLNEVVENDDITEKQRNKILEDMTDEVGELVLRDNYLQTQALSLALHQSSDLLDVHSRLIRRMEREGKLDRQIEFLPGKEEIDERILAGNGLTSPELSVLLAYVKNQLSEQLLATSLPDDGFYYSLLINYFPTLLRKNFEKLMPEHRLSREIVSTVVANEVVNRAGVSFIFRLEEETGASPESITRAFSVACDIFSMPSIWLQIEELDHKVNAKAQVFMWKEGRKLVERASRWLLRNRSNPIDICGNVTYFKNGIEQLFKVLPDLLSDSSLQIVTDSTEYLTSEGIPEELATRVAMFSELLSAMDIVEVSNSQGLGVEKVAETYFILGEKLDLPWLRDQIVNLPRSNRWQALSRAALRDDLYSQHRTLTRDVLTMSNNRKGGELRVDEWVEQNTAQVQRSRQVLVDLKTVGKADFNMLSVGMQEIRAMCALESPTTYQKGK